jgi:glycosyltransferase involved in cell wall biosynthesis
MPNLHFEYYDLPAWLVRLKKKLLGVHLYYLLWQYGASMLALKLHASHRFDLVHHITFGVFRQPSFMWRLRIPFVFGPLGGGERAPFRLRRNFGFNGWLKDLLRDIVNLVSCADPLLRKSFAASSLVIAKTPETLHAIPTDIRHKSMISLEIGIGQQPGQITAQGDSQTFRILFVGRFIYLKGLRLALQAFAEFVDKHPDATLTLVGKGPEKDKLVELAASLNVADRVQFIEWLPQQQLPELYASHNVFLFPSLHDSSGNVVLESFTQGLPVICLSLGGPATLVDNSCGRVIDVGGLDENRVVGKLAAALSTLAESHDLLAHLRQGALARAANYSWEETVDRVYHRIESQFPQWKRGASA